MIINIRVMKYHKSLILSVNMKHSNVTLSVLFAKPLEPSLFQWFE